MNKDHIIKRLSLLVEEWDEYAPDQKAVVGDIIRCSKKEAATDNQQPITAIALLKDIAMRLSSGKNICPHDDLDDRTRDFLSQQR